MTDPDDAPADGGRPAELLRRAGDLAPAPGPHVWAGVEAGMRDGRDGPATPVRLDDARRRRDRARPSGARRGLQLLGAAAVGALVTWAGLELVDGPDPEEVVARGELSTLADDASAGRAEVVQVDGHQRLRVELDDAPDAGDGYLEVWLLRPDVSGMVTLGVLDGTTAEFPLPPGLDLAEYAVVDISREHMDGDPGHGGDSLVRGAVG